MISQTCKQWNKIINENPTTVNPIWRQVAQNYFSHEDFVDLEHMYSLAFSDDGCEWRALLHLGRVFNLSKLKVFDGRKGKFIKRLLWVF